MNAFRGTYSDFKLVKTRGVVQVIFEVPIAEVDAAYQVLGGMPDAGHERWFGIAPLNMEAKEVMLTESAIQARPIPTETPPASAEPFPKPVRAPIAPDKRMTQRAGILCNDRMFQLWLKETNSAWKIMNWQGATDEERAVQIVHVYCSVKSRKEIMPGTQAARLWDEMLGKYAAWQACLEETA